MSPLDLAAGYDLSTPNGRGRALTALRKEKPFVVCVAASLPLGFVTRVAAIQAAGKRKFSIIAAPAVGARGLEYLAALPDHIALAVSVGELSQTPRGPKPALPFGPRAAGRGETRLGAGTAALRDSRETMWLRGGDPSSLATKVVDEVEALWISSHSSLLAARYDLDSANAAEVYAAAAEGGEEVDGEGGEGDEEEPPDLDDADTDSDDAQLKEEPGDDKEKPSMNLLRSLMRMHVNTGHRSLRRLARALTIAGAPRSTIRAVKFLRCSVCQEKRKKQTRRPAAMPRARAFGDRVHIDLVKCWDAADRARWVTNIVDAASGFQLCIRIQSKTSASVIGSFRTVWASWAVLPVTCVADLGPEFASEQFTAWLETHGSRVYHCPVEAPWQNGVAERAGGVFKAVLAGVCKEHSVVTDEEFDTAVAVTTEMRNADMNDSGFSPDQWVLGKARRVPGDLLGAGGVMQALPSHSSHLPGFHERVAMMETARRAITKVHFSKRLRAAELGRARTVPDAVGFNIGDMVYFYRESMRATVGQKKARNSKRLLLKSWHGPAMIVGKEGATAIYLGWRGNVTKCAPEAVRLASSLEQIAAESWSEALEDVLFHCRPAAEAPEPDRPQ